MKENFEAVVEHLVSGGIFLQQAIEILEKAMIEKVLQTTGGNQSAASKQLGIHRNTLQRKLTEYKLGNGRGRPRRKPPSRQPPTRKAKSGAA